MIDLDTIRARLAEAEFDLKSASEAMCRYARDALRLKEAERDAARYRWLRGDTRRIAYIHVEANVRHARGVDVPQAVDAAIDAFLAPADSAPAAHTHTDECWEPDSGCDMGRNEKFVQVAPDQASADQWTPEFMAAHAGAEPMDLPKIAQPDQPTERQE